MTSESADEERDPRPDDVGTLATGDAVADAAPTAELPTRWPPGPPHGQRCDLHLGVSGSPAATTDAAGNLTLERCPNPAVETLLSRNPAGLEMWVCAACADHAVARGYGIRNPRRRARS